MKRYPLCLLLIILAAKIFCADEDHHCYQKNFGKCFTEFQEAYVKLQGKGEDKKKMEEVIKMLGPVKEKTFHCLNETKAERTKCPGGFTRCATASIIFTDNTTLQIQSCDDIRAAICLTLINPAKYESYTGKHSHVIKCEFCEGSNCNGS